MTNESVLADFRKKFQYLYDPVLFARINDYQRAEDFLLSALTAKDKEIAEEYTRGRFDEAKTCAWCNEERIAWAEKKTALHAFNNITYRVK